MQEDRRGILLDQGRGMWLSDRFWMFMPYQLLDPDLILRLVGVADLAQDLADRSAGDRPADLTEVLCDTPGRGPLARCVVYVARDSGLVEAWDRYEYVGASEPDLARAPWRGWKRFGPLLLATDRGEGADWEIEVDPLLPRSVFEDPAPLPPP